MNSMYYLKTNRIFNPIRKYSWLFLLIVAFGGLLVPKLGLLIIPLMLGLAFMGYYKGKYWCGNFCPHGSLFDYIIMPLSLNKKIPTFLKSRTMAALMFSIFMYMLAGRLIKVFAIWGSLQFFDRLGLIFVMNYLMVTIIGSMLAFTISPRAWCSFCPMGSIQVIFHKIGTILERNKKADLKVSASRTEMCHGCAKCARVCPMQLSPYLEFNDNNQFDHEACIRCSTCVENCPAGILSLNNEENALEVKRNTSLNGYEQRHKISAIIKDVKSLSEDVQEYTFKLLSPEVLTYQAGQFILVKIQNSPQVFRAFSISSPPGDGRELSVTIKRVINGYGSNIIFDNFKVGDHVELEGPMGEKLQVDSSADKILFVGGGIGITPFVSMTHEVLHNSQKPQVLKLIYGARQSSDLIYNEHFDHLDQSHNGFEYIKVIASGDNSSAHKGFVTDVMKSTNLEGYKVYLCGPLPMINASIKALMDAGVKENDIFYECA